MYILLLITSTLILTHISLKHISLHSSSPSICMIHLASSERAVSIFQMNAFLLYCNGLPFSYDFVWENLGKHPLVPHGIGCYHSTCSSQWETYRFLTAFPERAEGLRELSAKATLVTVAVKQMRTMMVTTRFHNRSRDELRTLSASPRYRSMTTD